MDNGPMLLLKAPSSAHFLPLVEHSTVGLLRSFGKFLHGEFCSLRADCGFAFARAQDR
jgi:hypothetical protein